MFRIACQTGEETHLLCSLLPEQRCRAPIPKVEWYKTYAIVKSKISENYSRHQASFETKLRWFQNGQGAVVNASLFWTVWSTWVLYDIIKSRILFSMLRLDCFRTTAVYTSLWPIIVIKLNDVIFYFMQAVAAAIILWECPPLSTVPNGWLQNYYQTNIERIAYISVTLLIKFHSNALNK